MTTTLFVEPSGGKPWHGRLTLYGGETTHVFPCALGKAGIVTSKQEGDGGTPAGCFPLRRLFYRPDKLDRPETRLPAMAVRRDLGWCDEAGHPAYNRLVRLPYPADHEVLWRQDRVYDVIVTLGHNDAPPLVGLGSAIFMHVARPDFSPTEGCVALRLNHLLHVIKNLSAESWIDIRP